MKRFILSLCLGIITICVYSQVSIGFSKLSISNGEALLKGSIYPGSENISLHTIYYTDENLNVYNIYSISNNNNQFSFVIPTFSYSNTYYIFVGCVNYQREEEYVYRLRGGITVGVNLEMTRISPTGIDEMVFNEINKKKVYDLSGMRGYYYRGICIMKGKKYLFK